MLPRVVHFDMHFRYQITFTHSVQRQHEEVKTVAEITHFILTQWNRPDHIQILAGVT